jgi:hypothetical protein
MKEAKGSSSNAVWMVVMAAGMSSGVIRAISTDIVVMGRTAGVKGDVDLGGVLGWHLGTRLAALIRRLSAVRRDET